MKRILLMFSLSLCLTNIGAFTADDQAVTRGISLLAKTSYLNRHAMKAVVLMPMCHKATQTTCVTWRECWPEVKRMIDAGTAENLVVDAGKIDAWLTQIATLKVSKWLPDDTSVPSNKEASVQIMINQEPTEVNIYKEGYGDNAKYICVCNRTTHKAELAKLTAQKFIKDANELKVSE